MAATDADSITRTTPAEVTSIYPGLVDFGARSIEMDHRAFWIGDSDDETAVCIPYVDLEPFMDALVKIGLITSWTSDPERPVAQ